MLVIKTTVEGRQFLLSNSYFRNYLMGNFFSIERVYEDQYDQDGNLLQPKITVEMSDYAIHDKEITNFIESTPQIEVIKP